MKKALLKDSLKEIKKEYKRFFSIMVMAFLGVGIFAGIRVTSPDMKATIDNYFKENNVYDIELVSTLGMTDEDVELLSTNEYVKEVLGTYSKDVLVKIEENNEPVVELIAIDSMNETMLVDGRMPASSDECVVEQAFLDDNSKSIGDTIEIEDEDDEIVNKTLTIVGVVESPLYISSDRGTSSLGTGKVNYYVYITRDNFDMDVYTQIYITLKDATEYTTGTDAYEKYVEAAMESIEQYKDEINTRRYDELIDEANEKIKEAEEELESQKQENQQKLDDAQVEIDDGYAQIEESKLTLQTSTSEVYTTFYNYEVQIAEARIELQNGKDELETQKVTAQENIDTINSNIEIIQANIEIIDINIENINTSYNQIYATLENPGDMTEEEIAYLKATMIELAAQKETLEQTKIELNENIAYLKATIDGINKAISEAETEIKTQEESLNSYEEQILSAKIEVYQELADAQTQIDEAEAELEASEIELADAKTEFDEKIKEAEDEILDAKEELADIEEAKLYIWSREDNTGYSGFIQDTQSMENVAKVFPIIFFLVATLISLTSMTRMVEEQRQQIGTLKALGYTKSQISSKYILFATLATVIGGVLGMSVCFYVLPKIIWMMYGMMYDIPNFVIQFDTQIGAMGIGCAILCIVGATIYACVKLLVEKPAILMRPKAPKSGKRVLIENIPFLWHRFNFTTKVTIRNMFRYKKRFLMTIIGIMGCTALILFGFLLKDSVSSIVDNQYEKIFKYNFIVTAKSATQNEDVYTLSDEIEQEDGVKEVAIVDLTSASVTNGEDTEDVQIIVPDDTDSFYNMINLIDEDKNEVTLDDEGIILTEKVASILGVDVGDKITIITNDDEEIEATISATVKNYVYHYMYLSKDLYEELFGDYTINSILIQTEELTDQEEESLARAFMSNSKVMAVTDIDSIRGQIEDMMGLMKYVVWVLIVCAGMLALVVLYNLANVNISERIRELATIKVLGFYDNEVYDYVSKETTLLTVIGIILGMGGGIVLNHFILRTCEINVLRFEAKLNLYAFVVSALITAVFSIIVNIATYFSLKKIDMIESLKSIE